MAIAKWNDDLTTGMQEVDGQHKELIRMVNELHEALSKGRGKEVIEDAIRFLSNYVIEHFKMEEKLMLEHNYPAYIPHKKEHEGFVNDFTNLVKEYNSTANSSFLAITLQRSVVQWLVNHIMKVDKEMAKFLITGPGGKAA